MKLEDYDETPDEIFVLDTETTGLDGGPKDVVVDIGICAVDLSKGKVRDVYASVVGYDITEWNEVRKKAWIFENTDLTLDMVASAPPQDKVKRDVIEKLRGKKVTSYNVPFDMDKFLYREPWGFKGLFKESTDIMKAATLVCKLPSQYYEREYRFPKLDHAYSKIVEDDPAGIGEKQDHRALSDARMASYVMIKMFGNGDYLP
ncbi:MAG: 3'-5' exonuclease [Candidatus Methanoplasma sp.]|jgi:DNA polymerase-3 subunit epsilon|nr:3'-5' exonuclease [Candidatus Methanoplasma sp.]